MHYFPNNRLLAKFRQFYYSLSLHSQIEMLKTLDYHVTNKKSSREVGFFDKK